MEDETPEVTPRRPIFYKTGRVRWEYTFYVPRKGDIPAEIHWDADRLNELGSQGWEATGVIGDGLPSVGLLLKRPLS